MEESLLKSNFVGRDGFRWWIGQIPPLSCMGKQPIGSGWGNRFKVRIMGYHPANTVELPDIDLPWAQCLIPTTSGTGAANVASDVKLQQGDVVFGFFLDGDNAQVPVIVGAFGRTSYVPSSEHVGPFIPFTGYTNYIKKPETTLKPNESNEQNAGTQPSPIHIPPEIAKQIDEITYFDGIGDVIKLGDENSSTLEKISSEIDNFLKDVQKFSDDISNGIESARQWLNEEIAKRTQKLVSISSGMVGGMVNSLFNRLIPIIQSGLDMLYKQVYALVLAATGNPAVAHLAGVAAQTAMIAPVKILQDLIPCITNTIINVLGNTIKDILTSIVDNVANFTSCVADQVMGSIVNDIIGRVAVGLQSAIGGIQKILQFFDGFNLNDFLRSSIDSISGLSSILNCGQTPSAGSFVRKWTIGYGAGSPLQSDLQNILNVANAAYEISNASREGGNPFEGVQDLLGAFDIFTAESSLPDYMSALGSCYTGIPQVCSPPTVNIFGGNGTGASAIPIFGSIVEGVTGITASVIGVKVTNPGSGYVFPPFVEIADECGQGYGAVARATLDANGGVDTIYVISEGENYPPGEIEPYVLDSVTVINPGSRYSSADYAVDNFGNKYNIQVSNGYVVKVSSTPINTEKVEFTSLPTLTVISQTGSGAILKTKLDTRPPFQGEVKQVIDCVTK